MSTSPILALIGNPNAGKSSLFNQLTGMRQKTGNFPGVTVDKKSGTWTVDAQLTATVVDLPGVYSIYPKSLDEQLVTDILANPAHPDYPDVAVVVVDASNLHRNLLLFTQVADLGVPTVLALNMLDVAMKQSKQVNSVRLAMRLGVPVVRINARTGEGIDSLKKAVMGQLEHPTLPGQLFFDPADGEPDLITDTKEHYQLTNNYLALQYIIQHDGFSFLNRSQQVGLDEIIKKHNFSEPTFQANETITRYKRIATVVSEAVTDQRPIGQPTWSQKFDRILLHPVWGYAIFGMVLLLIFQAIFAWAQPFMDAIDTGVAWLNGQLKASLPAGPLTDLLTDGILAGIGGILVFIPQIAFLFLLVALLEESGYMSRVMVIMDRIMRKFGLNGRSVVPLISGVACAVPAIMATRSIGTRRDRLITILVTPLMSCSARLPIYTILIALVVPSQRVIGLFNLQGLALMGLYLLGLVSALLSAYVLKLLLKTKERGFFIMELPTFKLPRWNHVGMTVYDSVRSFVWEAGRVILAISIVLWVLASYGPGNAIEQAETRVRKENATLANDDLQNRIASERLEASYAGHFGHFIEPAIRPLGYDWKIGIALLSSFAAREVFVGTMSTIYSIGSGDDDGENTTIRQRLREERNPDTGQPMYTPALAWSLLVFYVFAMMCMSTLAATQRETKSWKWPAVQLAYMMILAYVSAFATYQLMK
ncbi:ferrous iron transport protein B [Spirosoma utsteinense]|uniref:Ferrous iron transport protein B n=1 Tax=Spirosoma utsteinense TaxID=2585773 RepID=A0ABR6W1X1_9BACT|nr:ferrous iron transport protein B [Spirosoma utsteinense]MBC3785179.1 ferrous iron transport protein B [Spirosoma utsteinense]MBC3790596.1 ferrous iron transport protein B [Spirosoma utsteinense]